eukprot:UN32332
MNSLDGTLVFKQSAIKQNNCGGAILDSTHIITAGHCVDGEGDQDQLEVHVSEYDKTDGSESAHYAIFDIESVAVHPGWLNTQTPDIAVITLASPISFV